MEIMEFIAKYWPLLIILLGISVIAAYKYSILALEKSRERIIDFDLNGNEIFCFEKVMCLFCFMVAIGLGGTLMTYVIWLMMEIGKI